MALTLQIKSSLFVKSAVNKREVKSASQMYRLAIAIGLVARPHPSRGDGQVIMGQLANLRY